MPTVEQLLSRTAARESATPPEQSSGDVFDALSTVGDLGLGALATVGNFLDLPGSSVRDTLAGRNPFDQWMSPFTDENRISGRDLISVYGARKNKETGLSGWLSDPLEGVLDVAGFGAEVLTDPFSPFGGPIAKATGLAKVAAKASPKVAAAGRVARTIFDPLAAPSLSAIKRGVVEPAKRYGASMFDWTRQGVTDPLVQDMASTARKQMRSVSDEEQAKAAMFFLKARDIGWSLEVDEALDMADPANLLHPQSLARVKGKRDAVRRYLEDIGPDQIPGGEYTVGDVVSVGETPTPRAVEFIERTPEGSRIKLFDDDALYADNQLKPLWTSTREQVPKELHDALTRIKSSLNGSKDLVEGMGANISDWIDPYISFAARRKGEHLSHLESRLGKSPVFWRRFRGLADALANPGNREQMLGGFREGTAGINRLYTDRAVEPRLRQLFDLTGGAPVIGTDGATHSVIPDYASVRHITEIADGIGVEPEDLWRSINDATWTSNPFDAYALRQSPDTFIIRRGVNNVGSARFTFEPGASGGAVAVLQDLVLDPAERGQKMSPYFFETLVRSLSSRPVDVGGTPLPVNAIRTQVSEVLSKKVFQPLGFRPTGLAPNGDDVLVRDVFSSQPGVAPHQAYPRLLPKQTVQKGLALVQAQMIADVASGAVRGIQPGRGRWSNWTDIRTSTAGPTPVTYNMRTVPGSRMRPSASGTTATMHVVNSPVDVTGAEMHMITLSSLIADQVRFGFDDPQRDIISDYLRKGEDVFIGRRVPARGAMAETVILAPTRVDRLSQNYTKFLTGFEANVIKDPLLFSEAASDEMYWHLTRNYSDRVDQWMPDVGPDGVQAFTSAGDALASPQSVTQWHRTHADLIKRVMDPAATTPGLVGLTAGMDALLRLDDTSLTALGMTQQMKDSLDTARGLINGVRAAAGSSAIINADAQIPLLDRYAALAGDMAEFNERRVLPMFSNDPIVDAADYTSRNKQMFHYLQGFVDLVSRMVQTTKAAGIPAVRTGDVQFGDQFIQGRTLGDLLNPDEPGSLFGNRVNSRMLTGHIHESLVRKGVYRRTSDAALRDKQLAEILNVRLLDDTATELRTFNELLSFDVLPELKPAVRAAQNMGTAFKSYQLSWPATAVRDGLGSMFNATIMSDFNPATALWKFGRKALDFARGAPVDPGGSVPEVQDLLSRMGWPDTPANRGRAFQSLWAAHHRAPSRHVNVEFADVSDLSKSGVAESVVSAVPGSGATPVGQSLREMLQSGGRTAVDNVAAQWAEGGGLQNINPLSASGPLGSKGMFSALNFPGRWKADEYGKPVQSRTSNIFLGAMNDFRGMIDTVVRGTFVQDQLAKGRTLTQAFGEADRVLTNSDPRNFTRFESQWLKTLMPFYGFMKQSIPLFLKELTTNPGGKLGATVRASRLSQGDEDGYVPYQYQDSLSIPLDRADDGSLRYLTSLGLMHEDSIKYAGNLLQGDTRGLLQKLISSGNPAIKWTIEHATNTSLYSQGPMGGRRLDDLDPTLGRIAVNIGLRDLPASRRPEPVGGPLLESLVAASPASRALSTFRTLTNSSDRATAVEKVLRLLSGFKIEAVSQEQVKRDIQDRLNAMQIAAGARPLSIATGTSNLSEELLQQGDVAGAEKLQAIEKVLSLLRKDLRKGQGKASKPKKERATVASILAAAQ